MWKKIILSKNNFQTQKRLQIILINLLFVILVIQFFSLKSSIASICDALDDTWIREGRELTQFEWDEIQDLNYHRGWIRDKLVSHNMGFESSVVLTQPVEGRLQIDFIDTKVKMVFSYEKKANIFQTDIAYLLPDAEEREQYDDMTVLYKEIVFKGTINIEGEESNLFGSSKNVPATLILQGKGNACFNGADYSKWIIKFKSKKDNLETDYVGSGTFLIHPSVLVHQVENVVYNFTDQNVSAEKITQYLYGDIVKSTKEGEWKIKEENHSVIIKIKSENQEYFTSKVVFQLNNNLNLQLKHFNKMLSDMKKVSQNNEQEIIYEYKSKYDFPNAVIISFTLYKNEKLKKTCIKRITIEQRGNEAERSL